MGKINSCQRDSGLSGAVHIYHKKRRGSLAEVQFHAPNRTFSWGKTLSPLPVDKVVEDLLL